MSAFDCALSAIKKLKIGRVLVAMFAGGLGCDVGVGIASATEMRLAGRVRDAIAEVLFDNVDSGERVMCHATPGVVHINVYGVDVDDRLVGVVSERLGRDFPAIDVYVVIQFYDGVEDVEAGDFEGGRVTRKSRGNLLRKVTIPATKR